MEITKQTKVFINRVILAGFLAAQPAVAADEIQEVQKPAEGTTVCMSKKPLVGAYYYPWYHAPGLFRKNTWNHVMRFRLKAPQYPEAGLYDSRDPEVIAGHIEQSVRGGVSFWAVSWWGPGSYTDRVFNEHILQHPDSAKLSYAILYESTGRLGEFENPDYSHWISDLKYLKTTYFDDPRYLKVNGRPAVFVYLSREYFRDRGQEALRQMREQLPEVYLVGDDVYFGNNYIGETTDEYKAEWAKNFDAVTAYDVYGQSIGKFGGTQKAIEYLAGNYQQVKKTANSVGTAFIPAIAPGYNDTAVRKGHPGRARY
ncbi:MAG: hypothetical protein MUC65_09830, partial [Pontiellaceae bacterium]|nr:hypothetical protein [Pontiellaceae bacterium]